MSRTELVIIDPQVDFCDPNGSLFVTGADQDMKRLADFIRNGHQAIDDINITLDSHHLIDVAHPGFWKDSSGNPPNPFTIITTQDLKDGKWTPFRPGLFQRAESYVQALEAAGRYPLCIWPPHCLIGSKGQAIVPEVFDAVNGWNVAKGATVEFVTKGSNILTEHYSAIKAEVPDPDDPTTQINTRFVQKLMDADEILVAGEAGSHCLANTVRDIANEFGDDSYVKKIVLLEDATSPVPGFEQFQTDFIDEMKQRGMRITTTVEYLSVGAGV